MIIFISYNEHALSGESMINIHSLYLFKLNLIELLAGVHLGFIRKYLSYFFHFF